MPDNILPPEFYQRRTEKVAQDLLGKILCFRKNGKIKRGRIVETEAYLGVKDRAAHSYGGRATTRVQSMYKQGGHAYVYMIYGIHFCLNVVTRTPQHPEAVLIRALEPMTPGNLKTNGPGRLCQAFGINKQQDGLSLFSRRSGIWVEDDGYKLQKSALAKGPRIGIDYAKEATHWPLRFWLKGNPFVSRSGKLSKKSGR